MLLALPASAAATHASVRWASPDTNDLANDHSLLAIAGDGSRVIFETDESITPDDVDGGTNSIYEWSAAQGTRLLTPTTAGLPAFFTAASDDASRVLIQTPSSMIGAGDSDGGLTDAYLVVDGVPQMASPGTTAQSAFPNGLSADGTKVFFSTQENIADGDGATDVFRWDGATVEELSDQGSGSATGAIYKGNSRDGSKVWFESTEAMDGDSDTGVNDTFEGTVAATPSILSLTNSAAAVVFNGASANGTHVFMSTTAVLHGADADATVDVYESVNGGAPVLVSPATPTSAVWAGSSADGASVFFSTPDAIDGVNDLDAQPDLYRRENQTTTSIVTDNGTSGAVGHTLGKVSPDGETVWFSSTDALIGADLDGGQSDVFVWTATGGIDLVSFATDTAASTFAGATDDGQRVFFRTTESLDLADPGADADVYEVYNGATWLATRGTSAGILGQSMAAGGRFIAVETSNALDPADADAGRTDVYRFGVPVPSVQTGAAGVAGTSASLTGTVNPNGELSSWSFEYGTTTSYGTQTATVAAGDGTSAVPTAATVDGLEPGTTYHYRLSASNLAGTGNGGDGTFTTAGAAQTEPPPQQPPPQQPRPSVPPPVLAQTFNAERVSGRVLARVPGTTRFVPIEQLVQLPTGTIIDARRGRVRLYAADGKGGIQSAEFYEGMFRLVQLRRNRGLVELHLFGGSFKGCGKAVKPARAAAGKKTRSIRHLWGDGKGRFRTVGRFSSASLRGTQWLTDDRCDGTLTRVTKGSVNVRDFVRRRTILLRAGKRYLARRR